MRSVPAVAALIFLAGSAEAATREERRERRRARRAESTDASGGRVTARYQRRQDAYAHESLELQLSAARVQTDELPALETHDVDALMDGMEERKQTKNKDGDEQVVDDAEDKEKQAAEQEGALVAEGSEAAPASSPAGMPSREQRKQDEENATLDADEDGDDKDPEENQEKEKKPEIDDADDTEEQAEQEVTIAERSDGSEAPLTSSPAGMPSREQRKRDEENATGDGEDKGDNEDTEEKEEKPEKENKPDVEETANAPAGMPSREKRKQEDEESAESTESADQVARINGDGGGSTPVPTYYPTSSTYMPTTYLPTTYMPTEDEQKDRQQQQDQGSKPNNKHTETYSPTYMPTTPTHGDAWGQAPKNPTYMPTYFPTTTFPTFSPVWYSGGGWDSHNAWNAPRAWEPGSAGKGSWNAPTWTRSAPQWSGSQWAGQWSGGAPQYGGGRVVGDGKSGKGSKSKGSKTTSSSWDPPAAWHGGQQWYGAGSHGMQMWSAAAADESGSSVVEGAGRTWTASEVIGAADTTNDPVGIAPLYGEHTPAWLGSSASSGDYSWDSGSVWSATGRDWWGGAWEESKSSKTSSKTSKSKTSKSQESWAGPGSPWDDVPPPEEIWQGPESKSAKAEGSWAGADSLMSLPTEAIDAILAMASSRHNVPSPRGVADPSVFAASPPGEGKRTGPGSAVECVEYATAPATSYSAMDHFRDAAHAQRRISMCAKRFLNQVAVEKAFTMTGHCYRMTVHPRDVAEALELFVEVDAEDDWYRSFPTGSGAEGKGNGAAEEEDQMDQDWEEENHDITISKEESKEKAAEDDTFVYDASDSEGEEEENPPYIDDAIYAIEDAATPEFDAAFPPVEESKQMTDEQFCEEVLVPVLEEHRLSGYPRADGVDAMLKRAMYAFLVAKLS
ncbi:hypothetical protein ACHAXT_012606 [Thalassiosira profunda]